ncbi:MAG: S9 family peptidase [Bacteroidales bacterium]|nr:MAG: S9 family peptidase [Bacteroidales bacterium]
MGTSFRSKEFEEVCYKNLKDAGLPDRIAWIKAAAKKYPYMDIDRVGIYGCSAGGQESTAAVLQYPEFYKAAYSACGCHDNRMDKIWWNEQWMGYPVDESYAEAAMSRWRICCNVRLCSSWARWTTMSTPPAPCRLVNALIKAGKDFELVVLPGERHTWAAPSVTTNATTSSCVRSCTSSRPTGANSRSPRLNNSGFHIQKQDVLQPESCRTFLCCIFSIRTEHRHRPLTK